jgi:hypothetical protein
MAPAGPKQERLLAKPVRMALTQELSAGLGKTQRWTKSSRTKRSRTRSDQGKESLGGKGHKEGSGGNQLQT